MKTYFGKKRGVMVKTPEDYKNHDKTYQIMKSKDLKMIIDFFTYGQIAVNHYRTVYILNSGKRIFGVTAGHKYLYGQGR